ncbi:toxin-activating lysine-acyltransferase [Thalassospira povalilytica]|uniref:toxin-activating lysine-acyltransferase n=1 Tax=Thalassospira povalilytica TaxID=732237 RepID=UPI003AA7E72B
MTDRTAQTVDAQTFGSTMGNAVWLMTMDKAYCDRPIRDIEAMIAIPILLRQFKLYSQKDKPIAFLTWAAVSDEVKAKLDTGGELEFNDWRSGESVVVIDVVSPFTDASAFRDRFLAKTKTNIMRGCY